MVEEEETKTNKTNRIEKIHRGPVTTIAVSEVNQSARKRGDRSPAVHI